MMSDTELLNSIPPEERARIWEDMVRREINDYLDSFLPEAITGNIGVIYDRPVIDTSPVTNVTTYDEKKATGVKILIEFKFADTVQFFDKQPE
jgi:hypothetical protein